MDETAVSNAPIHSEQPTMSSVIEKKGATSDVSFVDKGEKVPRDHKDLEAAVVPDNVIVEEDEEHGLKLYQRFRPLILGGFALVILAWWISATTLKATRHRWIVQTVFAWSFIGCVLPFPSSRFWSKFG